MVGSKDRVGSFELRGRTQDTVQGLISEAYIQQYFQEVFLQLFYEDPEFREQVLKCLLTGDNDEGTVQVSKPRRTWFNGMSGIQEISREEARYFHICSENPSIDSDLSTEAGDERYHIALPSKPAIQELPTKHLGELKLDASLGPLAKEIPHSTVLGSKDRDMNLSGVPCGGNSNINYLLREGGTVTSGPESLEDRPQGPIPLEVASDSQHKSLEESLTSPCVHERRIQTWKANPLFLLGNIDSDSNDSWQQESPNVAWMDDLENGKMLQEVKMRKVKRLEESRPARKAEGYDRSRVHSKSEHEGYIQCNVQGLPHPTEESKTLQVKGRKRLNEDQTENPSIGSFVRAIPSCIIVIPKDSGGTTVTPCPEKKLEECLALGGNETTNLPLVREGRDPGPPFVCLHGDDVGDLTSSRPSAETTALHQNHILKPPHNVVPQELPIVFLHEDEKALFKQPSPHVSIPIHELDGKVRLASGRISGAQHVVLSTFEKPKSPRESISPVEAKVLSGKGLNVPVSNTSRSEMLDETIRIEEERKSLAPFETKVISEKGLNAPISNISSFAMFYEINRIEEERNSLAPVEAQVIAEKGLNTPISKISSFAMLDETNRIEEERKSLAPLEAKVISVEGSNAPISNISSFAMLDETKKIEEERKSLAPLEAKVISEEGPYAPISIISSFAMLDGTNRIEEERKSLAPLEAKVISVEGSNAPISNISSFAMLDGTNRIEEERKSLAPVEAKVIFEEGLNAPISNISSFAMLDETNRIEEERKSLAPVEAKVIFEEGLNAPISNISSFAMLDETNRIEVERKSLAPVEAKVISEEGLNAPISSVSSFAMLDETNRIEEERNSLATVEKKVISRKGLNAPISKISSFAMLDETNRIEEERNSLATVEKKVISKKGLNAPISNITSSTMLDETNRIEEKSKSVASSYRKQLSKSGMKLVSMTDKTSLPRSCAIDDQREEICLSDSISESTKSLTEELHVLQRRILILGTPSQASVCGSFTGDETTEAPDRCRDMSIEKELTSLSTPKSSIKSPLVAIAEDEHVVDPPKPLAHNAFRPTATRTPFRPGKDIHWQPPKRNIQVLGMKKMKSPAQHPLENAKKANIKWGVACDCP